MLWVTQYYSESNGWMILKNELEIIGKETDVWFILSYYPRIFLKWLVKTKKTLVKRVGILVETQTKDLKNAHYRPYHMSDTALYQLILFCL
jgi:hypothetical protein